MHKVFYVWRLNPIAETFCSNPFEFFSKKLISAFEVNSSNLVSAVNEKLAQSECMK